MNNELTKYKQTKIGIIPNDWEVKRLGDLGEFKNGINKDKEDFGFGIPFINLNDIFTLNSNELGLVNATKEEQKLYDLIGGDILFVRSSVKPQGVGLTSVIEKDLEKTVYSGFIIRYRLNNKKVLNLNYKKYCFNEPYFRYRLMCKSTISANTNINQQALKSLLLPIPPLPEQKAIADCLTTWDKGIEKLTALITAKKTQKKAILQSIFNDELRIKNWKEVRLGDFLKESKIVSQENDKIKRLSVKLHLKGIERREIRGTEADSTVFYRRKAGQFIYGKQNFHNGAFGIIPEKYNNFETTSDIPSFDINDKVNHNFIFYFLSRRNFYKRMENRTTGTGSKRLHPSEFLNTKVSIPPLAEQQEIANVLSTADKEIALLEQKLMALQRQKQGLMQVLLTGQVRIKN